jgi:DnaJ-class molecular chaperone
MSMTPIDETKYVLVPREPTEEMHEAGLQAVNDYGGGSVSKIWEAMLSASPASGEEHGNDNVGGLIECPRCKGLGHVPLQFSDDVCGRCGGLGKIERSRAIAALTKTQEKPFTKKEALNAKGKTTFK